MAREPSTTPPFASIPSEVRSIIYQFALLNPEPIGTPDAWDGNPAFCARRNARQIKTVGLLHRSVPGYEIARRIYFGANEFEIWAAEAPHFLLGEGCHLNCGPGSYNICTYLTQLTVKTLVQAVLNGAFLHDSVPLLLQCTSLLFLDIELRDDNWTGGRITQAISILANHNETPNDYRRLKSQLGGDLNVQIFARLLTLHHDYIVVELDHRIDEARKVYMPQSSIYNERSYGTRAYRQGVMDAVNADIGDTVIYHVRKTQDDMEFDHDNHGISLRDIRH